MKKLEKIIHLADLHFYNVKRHDEYREVFSKFLVELNEIKNSTDGDIAVLIAGDFFHQKIQVSNELNVISAWFIREVSDICDILIYAGNHDLIIGNKDRTDTISGILDILNINNVFYIDKMLGYKSGLFEYKGFTFALYSIFEDYIKPDLIKAKTIGNKIIGLFHGAIVGSETSTGYSLEHGTDCSIFEGCDVVMAGDIHKRQEIRHKGVRIVYPGSAIQQDYGESITKHGYLIWNMNNLRYSEHELENPYKFYKLKINSLEELEHNEEVLINY